MFIWSAMHDRSPTHFWRIGTREALSPRSSAVIVSKRYRRRLLELEGIEERRQAASWACLSPSFPRRASKRYLCARVAVGLKKRGICCHHNTTSICDLPPPPEVFLSWEVWQNNIPSHPLFCVTSLLLWSIINAILNSKLSLPRDLLGSRHGPRWRYPISGTLSLRPC